MKISVYAICKNEEKFVNKFLDSIQPELLKGDNITILDTGSTDGTVDAFLSRGVKPFSGLINPWRFDDARNVSLALIPEDIDVALCIDLDEQLQPGWREALETSWVEGTTRLRYRYTWSWKPDGSPDVQYYADKIHLRKGYRWKLPAHEVLSYQAGEETQTWSETLTVHHYADATKSRGQYLGLMEQALKEEPGNDRMQHYYARELYFYGRQVEASEWFQKHLANPNSTWRHERSQSMLYLSKLNGNEAWKDMWSYRAAAECPERREVWWNLYDREISKGNTSLAEEFKKKAESLPFDRFYLSGNR